MSEQNVFIPWPKNKFVRHLEGKGHALRQRLSLGHMDRLEPATLAQTYDHIVLADLAALAGGTASPEMELLRDASSSWSAIAYREARGRWLITWNPWHSEARMRVSVMEEIAHIVLEHRPTAMVTDPATGLPRRTYTPSKEREAYGVAAAAVLPFGGLVSSLRSGNNEDEIADHFGVSVPLVTMRMNTTRVREEMGAADAPPVHGAPSLRGLSMKRRKS